MSATPTVKVFFRLMREIDTSRQTAYALVKITRKISISSDGQRQLGVM